MMRQMALLVHAALFAMTAAGEWAPPQPGTQNVTLSWFDATTDHFTFEPADPPTFKQRVFT
jgi:hypothetical protein